MNWKTLTCAMLLGLLVIRGGYPVSACTPGQGVHHRELDYFDDATVHRTFYYESYFFGTCDTSVNDTVSVIEFKDSLRTIFEQHKFVFLVRLDSVHVGWSSDRDTVFATLRERYKDEVGYSDSTVIYTQPHRDNGMCYDMLDSYHYRGTLFMGYGNDTLLQDLEDRFIQSAMGVPAGGYYCNSGNTELKHEGLFTGLAVQIDDLDSIMYGAPPTKITNVRGVISADKVWRDTVIVTGDVIVDSVTLTIMPGTVVRFGESNDNIVYGDSNAICIAARNNGTITALGTFKDRITFTTAAAFPAPGSWREIRLLGPGTASRFAYCVFEYAVNGIGFGNAAGITEQSAATITNCEFFYCEHAGVWIGDGSNVDITGCYIADCNHGVCSTIPGTVSVTYTVIYTASAGILAGGSQDYPADLKIDHVTIDDIDMMLDEEPKWWSGYGIFLYNTGYTASITNSIIGRCTLRPILEGDWTVLHDYNCLNLPFIGIPPDPPDLGPNSMEGDPFFTDAASGDYSLADSSRCIGAASDGSNMGAWQDIEGWPWGAAAISDYRTEIIDFGLPGETAAGVYDLLGQRVYRPMGRGVYLEVDKKGNVRKRVW